MNRRALSVLVLGLMILGLVGSALFIRQDYVVAHANSTSARLTSQTKAIGLDFAGQITDQYVAVGDKVSADQKLFTVKSPLLIQALSSNQLTVQDLPYKLDSDNQLVITAPNAGYIASITSGEGDFVKAASQIATITSSNQMTVTAEYKLSGKQFENLHQNSEMNLTLPDGTKAKAHIMNFVVAKQGKPLTVVVNATADNLGEQVTRAGEQGLALSSDLTLHHNTYWERLAAWYQRKTN